MNSKLTELASRLNDLPGGPMSESDIEYLRDTQAFIDFAIENGVSLLVALSIIGHDVNALVRYGGSVEESRKDGFLPKVSGHAVLSKDDFGDHTEVD